MSNDSIIIFFVVFNHQEEGMLEASAIAFFADMKRGGSC